MSNQPTFDNGSEDIDLMAAEYVLGVLQPQAHREAQRRIEGDPAFAAEVARWESWFSPWLQSIAPVEVSPNVWSRVRATLWQHELPERGTAPAPTTRPSLWESLGFWRGVAAGGFAVAVACLAVLLLNVRQLSPQQPPVSQPVVVTQPPAAPMVVSLRQDDGSTAYTATIDTARGTVALVPVHLGGDPDLSPELWLIPAGGKPHSLGMIKRGEAMLVDIPEDLREAAKSDSLFAVSLEPAGSQPHQAPTGPVVAKGNLIRL